MTMRYLMVILMILAQLSHPSASRAENDLLGLDADLMNFANGVFLFQQLSELEPSASSTVLFTKVRAHAETALHRHKLRFLAFSVERQAAMIDQVRNVTSQVNAAKLAFPGDATRAEVYRHLLSWAKGRVAGLIEEYKISLQIEIQEQRKMIRRISKAS
jgi:hypothetical protein